MARNRGKSERLKAKEKRERAANARAAIALGDAFVFAVEALNERDLLRSSRKLQGQVDMANARRLKIAAQQTIDQGREEAARIQVQGRQEAGALKARLAASGVQVDFGSSAEAVEDIKQISGEDASAIRTNAFRRAHNLKLQASQIESQVRLDRITGKREERETALTGGLKALRSISTGFTQAGKG